MCSTNRSLSKGGGKEDPGFISQTLQLMLDLWNCCMCEYVEVAEHMVIN